MSPRNHLTTTFKPLKGALALGFILCSLCSTSKAWNFVNTGNCTNTVQYAELLWHKYNCWGVIPGNSSEEWLGGYYWWFNITLQPGQTVTLNTLTCNQACLCCGNENNWCMGVSKTIFLNYPGNPAFPISRYGSDLTFYVDCNGYKSVKIPGYDDQDFSPFVTCNGMPVWQVSEPFMNLWVVDEPLGYQPARGPRVSLYLSHKQRESRSGYDSQTFSAGKGWNIQWLSYATTNWNQSGASPGVDVSTPGGGKVSFYGDGTGAYQVDRSTHTKLSGDITNGFTVSYSDGSADVYGFITTNSTGAFSRAFMSQRRSANGQQLRLDYYDYYPSNSVVRLKCVVDGDGLTNWIYYATTNSYSTNLITQVVDPFGRSVALNYDTNGFLTNIVDVASLSSSFLYDTNGWMTNMSTPYGPTAFQCTDTSGMNLPPYGRSVRIIEPDGGTHLYLYTNNAPGIASSYSTNDIPVTYPFSNTFATTNLNLRTTFYWNKRQYASLSTTNIAALTDADFLRGRMRHWLAAQTYSSEGADSCGTSIGLERSPSVDGTTEGQKTWYDYAGKSSSRYEGAEASPLYTAQVNPNGATTFARISRNSFGLVTNEVSTYSAPNGPVALRTNTYTFAANAVDLVRVTNALGIRISSNSYNGFHEVLTNLNALNEQTTYTYNSTQQVTSITAPSGLVITNVYGADGFLSQQIAVGFATNSFIWANDLIQTRTDARGLTVNCTWDNLQRLRRLDFPDGTSITNSFDKLDLVRVTDRMGYNNSFGYNSVRQLIAATNANNVVTRYSYCSCGALESVTNAFGANEQQVTTFSWDQQGHLLQTVGPDAYSSIRRYNSLGQVTNILDGLTSVTNWYNNQGLLVAASNSVGRLASVVYDVLDRPVTNTGANSVTTSSTFDNLNRLLTRGYPDASLAKFVYSSRGLVAYTNQLNFPTLFGRDSLGRAFAETNANSEIVQFTYAPAGDLVTLTDGKNQTTTWHFDEYGRATNKLDAVGNISFKFSYDLNNRLTNRWTPAKGNTAYGFDPMANLTSVQYPASSNISLVYDTLNRLTNMADGVGTTKFIYTAASQLTSEDGPWASDTVSYTYNNRLRSTLNLLQPSASDWTNAYGYDSVKRLTNVTSRAGSFGYIYDPQHSALVSQLLLPNSAFITNSFDALARLTSTILKSSSGGTIDAYTYTLDPAGQRTNLTRNVVGAISSLALTYDPIGQLKSAVGTEADSTPRFNERFGYTYDPAGNLNFRTNNDLLQSFGVNSLNELTNISRNATMTVAGTTTSAATNVTVNASSAAIYADYSFARTNLSLADGNNTITAVARDAFGRVNTNATAANLPAINLLSYDLNGNLRTNGNEILEYDDENQLVTNWVAGAWKSEFAYDGFRRRRIERDYTWSGGAWSLTNEVRLIYDGALIIQHRNASNFPTLTLTRGLDLSGSLQGAGGIGGLLAFIEPANSSAQHYFYHSDGSGNVTCLINTNQLVVGRYLYDPFGDTVASSGPKSAANPYQFSSKPVHTPSGKHDFLYRWYLAKLQRFANADPIAESGGLNLHRLAGNNPLSKLDKFGLQGTLSWSTGGGSSQQQTWDVTGFSAKLNEMRLDRLTHPQPSVVDSLLGKDTAAQVRSDLAQIEYEVAKATWSVTPIIPSLYQSLTHEDFDGNRLSDGEVAVSETFLAIDTATMFMGVLEGASRLPCVRTVPLGFASGQQFRQATAELEMALEKSGITDASIGVRGSSVIGISSETAAPFSAASDIDFFVESSQLTEGFQTSRNIPGFVHPDKISSSFDAIAEWSQIWSENLGRSVSVGGFRPGTVTGAVIRH
jgi:RHS repeat-associated protein